MEIHKWYLKIFNESIVPTSTNPSFLKNENLQHSKTPKNLTPIPEKMQSSQIQNFSFKKQK